MIVNTHCMTCGVVIGHRWKDYIKLTKEFKENGKTDPEHPNKTARGMALDALKLKKTCCRQSMLSHIELSHRLRNRHQD